MGQGIDPHGHLVWNRLLRVWRGFWEGDLGGGFLISG
jgi:hypothetical protein